MSQRDPWAERLAQSRTAPLALDGRSVFADREAFIRRFVMAEILGPPLALRRRTPQSPRPQPDPRDREE